LKVKNLILKLITSACLAWMSLLSSFAYANPQKILILGDSLSAEYGLKRNTGWVHLLEKRLSQEKLSWQIVNASISGETTAGGKTRLTPLLAQHQPQVVVIELGANDALRGLSLVMTENNLKEMVQRSQQAGAKVLLIGMRIPPNYGLDYTEKFFQVFGKVAHQHQVPLVPFFLEGVAQRPELFQDDRIHPNAAAQSIMLNNVWPKLKPLLQ